MKRNILGLFASDIDGNEILYAVCIEPETPDYMPAFGGKTVSSITYKMNTKVDISSQVTLELNPGAIPSMEQVNNLTRSINSHTEANIYGENGVHGMRYFNEELQVMNESGEWVEIETGGGSGGGITPSDIKDLRIKVGNQKLTVFWSDPGNLVVEGQVLSTWKGTRACSH